MTSSKTGVVIYEALKEMTSDPTAHELSQRLSLSPGTVRKHLYRLMDEGRVLAMADPDVPGPKGTGALRWSTVSPPLGRAAPTDQLLCLGCSTREFQHEIRYRRALNDRGCERWDAAWSAWIDDEGEPSSSENPDGPPCDICGRPLLAETGDMS